MGVSAHLETLETRFAYRTRLIDLVWARVPIVAAAGDEWSARVAAEGLGEVFAPGDADGLAAALRRVADAGRGGTRAGSTTRRRRSPGAPSSRRCSR